MVFKGGGAKGVAYVGAVTACRRAGIEPHAVAGSSAGAITATLVAAGVPTERLFEFASTAMAKIERPVFAFLKPRFRALLRSSSLEIWLDQVLAKHLRVEGRRPTFDDILAVSEVHLYVVAMDLSSQQPVVFCPELTPDFPVARAVVASSAIPVAFPSVKVRDPDGIRRLVDGGAWANYPSFVFLDADFRAFHGLEDEGEPRPLLGFALENEGPASALEPSALCDAPQWSSVDQRGATAREFGLFGALVTSPVFLTAIAVLPLITGVVFADWLVNRLAGEGIPSVRSVNPLLELAALVGVATGVGLVGLIVVPYSIVALRLGRAVADEGLGGAVAAMGVGPKVPYWTGFAWHRNAHHLVRIVTPPELGTLSFRASSRVVEQAIDIADAQTMAYLHSHLGVLPPPPDVDGLPGPTEPDSADRPPEEPRTDDFRNRLRVVAVIFVGLLLVTLWWVVLLGSIVNLKLDKAWWGLIPPATPTVVLLWVYLRRRRARATRQWKPFARSQLVVDAVTGLWPLLPALVITWGLFVTFDEDASGFSLDASDLLMATSTEVLIVTETETEGEFLGVTESPAVGDRCGDTSGVVVIQASAADEVNVPQQATALRVGDCELLLPSLYLERLQQDVGLLLVLPIVLLGAYGIALYTALRPVVVPKDEEVARGALGAPRTRFTPAATRGPVRSRRIARRLLGITARKRSATVRGSPGEPGRVPCPTTTA